MCLSVQEVAQLQAAIKYESGDLRGCRALLDQGLAAGDPTAQLNAGCVLYKEAQYAAAAAAFASAAQADSSSPELAYAVAACQYRLRDHASALATLSQIVEAGVQLHPELGIGTQTEGMEVRQGCLKPQPAWCLSTCQLASARAAAAPPELTTCQPPTLLQARSVGNSAKLKQTALVEAFNLRAAVELMLGNPAGGGCLTPVCASVCVGGWWWWW
jgi:tetratricopeptide repeat protein 30